MDEHELKAKLDMLADMQAQIDLLEMQKRDLLNAVEIPAEVLAAQEEANKARQKADADALAIQKEIRATTELLIAEIVEPELPAEYIEAMAAARAQRDDIQSQAQSRYEQLAKKQAEIKAKIDADLQARVGDIFAQVERRKMEIDAEFSGKAEAARENMDKLTNTIKDEVAQIGHSVKGDYYHAVYVKGRVTWNTDMLDGMIAVIPQLAKARKEGKPSVTLRRI